MATRYLLNCPSCNHEHQVETQRAGQEIDCSQCGKSITIPRLGDLKRLPVYEVQPSKGPGGASRFAKVMFSTGLLIAVFSAVAGGGLYWYAGTLQHPIDLDLEIQQLNEDLDQMQAAELWDTWHQFLAGSSLGEWQEDSKIRYNKQSAILKNFSFGIFGLAGIGVLMMVSTGFISRR